MGTVRGLHLADDHFSVSAVNGGRGTAFQEGDEILKLMTIGVSLHKGQGFKILFIVSNPYPLPI